MMLRRILIPMLGCAVLGLVLSGCKAPPPPSAPPKPAAVQAKGVYTLGRPYQINGRWYYPADDFTYDETGIASVYGADATGTLTANGEAFDPNVASAGHRMLALPTIVQVTNL